MRSIRVRDSLSGELRELPAGEDAGIYACGPTVYSRIHIGNARPFVVFSLFARFLRSQGYPARLVVNVTDVNDKIYDAAREAGEPSAEFARRMTDAYMEDTDRLGLGRPDAEPLATETIGPIVALIEELVGGRARVRIGRRRLLPRPQLRRATASSPTAAPRRWTRGRRPARSR